MAESGDSDARTLAELRAKIDAIDDAMHDLLIERGTVIDTLIRVKKAGRPGAAFRPQREAEMMRRLAARHSGRLPMATVEHLWREIITTFTHMQSPFGLVVDSGDDAAGMRDVARFHFGFSVDIVSVDDPAAVVARIAQTRADLGLIGAGRARGEAPWWRLLGGVGPQLMAKLPFIERAAGPADMPAFVISPPLSDPGPPDFRAFAALAPAGGDMPEGVLLLDTGGRDGREVLLGAAADDAAERLQKLGYSNIAVVGGFGRGVAREQPARAEGAAA